MKLKYKKIRLKFKKKNIIILSLAAIFVSIFLVFNYINKKMTPILMNYAESKATNLATLVITQAVNNKVFKEMNPDDIFVTEKDSNGNTLSIDFNPITVNKLLNMVTKYVQDYLQKIEDGNIDNLGVSDSIFSDYDIGKLKHGIIYEIPSGVVFKNSLLSNLGPKIPVKLNLVGDVISDIDTNITNYGINNALVKVTLKVEVNMQVLLPFSKKNVRAQTNIPVALKLIQGGIPNFYYGLDNYKKNNN